MLKTLVPGEGPKETCKLCIIGEAPGSEEVKLGRPFVGKSGELLTKALIRSGISREQCYVTNVVKEQPPGNNISIFLPTILKPAKPPTKEFLEYEKLLHEELKSCSANVYLCLGNTPLYTLCRKLQITKRRGSILEGTVAGRQVKVIPTVHPAMCLREHLSTYLLYNDLDIVAEEMLFPELRLPERELLIRPKFHEVLTYLEEALTHRIIAADIETANKNVTCISIALTANRSMSIPFVEGNNDYWNPEQEAEIWRKIAEILEANTITKVFQNAIYDCSFLLERYGIKTWPVEDTMIAQAIIAPEFPKGLDFLCSMYTREPYYKDEGKEWKQWKEGQDVFWRYNAKDSAVTLEILPQLKAILVQQQNIEAYQRKLSLLRPLMYMQQHGLKLDNEGLKKESLQAEKDIQEMQDRLNKITGTTLNVGSFIQMSKYFYGTKGHKAYTKRATGKVTCDEKALEKLAVLYPEASLIIDLRELKKAKSTYFDCKVDEDLRYRCIFNPIGTEGDRVSSRKSIFDTGGNFQNLPMRFKKYVIADDGYVMYEIDLVQAENRLVAYIAPESNMINAFERGIDLHKQTAGLIFNKKIEDVTKEERQAGKQANHGLNYDLGYGGFAVLNRITNAQAKFIVDRYHQVYPGVRRYHQWVRDELQRTRSLRTPFGRYKRFWDRWGDDLFKQAYSYIPQSTVAEKINRDGVIFIYQNQDIFYAVELINTVHDSIVFQIPLSLPWTYHAECLRLIADSLEAPIEYKQFSISIPIDLAMGLRYGKREYITQANGTKTPNFLPGSLIEVELRKTDPLELPLLLEQTYFKLKEEVDKDAAETQGS